MTSELLIPIHQLDAEICKRSLFDFVKEFWSEIIPDDPIWNWHIPYLCDELEKSVQTVIHDKPKLHDLIINICPGTTKSTIVSIMLPCWLWANAPDKVILLNTISHSNAMKFAQKRQDILNSSKYQRYFPEIKIRPDSTARMSLKNTSGGEITQYTTKGRITGDHGHIRIDDDPMSYQDAISEAQAEKCIDGYKAFATRNKSLSKTVYIQVMQRLSAIDSTAHALSTLSNVKHIVLPASKNDKIKPAELADNYIDDLLDPIRLSVKNLQEIKMGLSDKEEGPMSDTSFDAQFLQDVESKEGLMYENKLQTEPFSQIEWSGFETVVSAIDPKDDGEDTYGQVYAYLRGDKYYIKDVIYNTGDSDYNLPIAIKKDDKHNPIRTYVEKNGVGGLYAKMLKNQNIKGLKTFANSEDKMERIGMFKWIVQQHFVFDSENKDSDYLKFMQHMNKLSKTGNKKMVGAADVCTHLAKALFLTGKFKN